MVNREHISEQQKNKSLNTSFSFFFFYLGGKRTDLLRVDRVDTPYMCNINRTPVLPFRSVHPLISLEYSEEHLFTPYQQCYKKEHKNGVR
jgi:hypothetical protein